MITEKQAALLYFYPSRISTIRASSIRSVSRSNLSISQTLSPGKQPKYVNT